MGALTSNRKRTDECFSLCSPSPSPSPLFNSLNNNLYGSSNHIDTRISKKARISYIQTPGKVIDSSSRSASRLSRYPEPVKLRREVQAPCRVNKFGFSSSGVKREDSWIRKKSREMGNALYKLYDSAKFSALGTLRHVKVPKEVIDVDAEPSREDVVSKDWGVVEIAEDGNEVRSVVSDDYRVLDSDGVEECEILELDGKARESGAIRTSSAVSDLMKVEHANLDREAYKDLLSNVDTNYSPKLRGLEFEIQLNEAKLEALRSSDSLKRPKQEKKPGEDLLREPFLPLTEEDEREVTRALSNSNRRKLLVTHENSNIQITGEILQCLRPGAWLNDEVINVYLELLKERERREPKKFLNCHFFNTFFYKKLIGGRNGYDYKAVRRWTTQKKLGYGLVNCDKIFVPIHKEVHWCLAIINKKDKSFQYLDSLGGRDRQVLRVLAKYFADEVKDKSGQEIDVSSWELEYVEDLPEQQNGFDCGVFMIKYADFYSRGLGLHFSQENMPYFRLRTAKEILKLRAD